MPLLAFHTLRYRVSRIPLPIRKLLKMSRTPRDDLLCQALCGYSCVQVSRALGWQWCGTHRPAIKQLLCPPGHRTRRHDAAQLNTVPGSYLVLQYVLLRVDPVGAVHIFYPFSSHRRRLGGDVNGDSVTHPSQVFVSLRQRSI